VVPCIVNNWLKLSALTTVDVRWPAAARHQRSSPPIRKEPEGGPKVEQPFARRRGEPAREGLGVAPLALR